MNDIGSLSLSFIAKMGRRIPTYWLVWQRRCSINVPFFPIYLLFSLLFANCHYFILSFISNLALHFSFFIIFYLSPPLYLQCRGQAYAFLVPIPLCLAGCLALQIINAGHGTRGPMSLSAPQPLAGTPHPTGNAQH